MVTFLALVVALLSTVSAVDRTKFRTCDQGSFCRRFKKWITRPSVEDAVWSLVPASKTATPDGFSYQLQNTHEAAPHLLLSITVFDAGMVRLKLNEIDSIHPRYELPAGDVIVEPKPEQSQKMDVGESGGASVIKFTAANSVAIEVKLNHSPLKIDVTANGELVQTLNSRNFLNFERYRKNGENRPPDAKAAEGIDTAYVDAASCPNLDTDGLWEENFGGHTDKKPRGPASFGFDVTFQGNVASTFGFAEHASANNLETFSEPYRFFNLDVFEYELDNSMALYGAVPFMQAVHRTGKGAQASGFLLINPSETFVKLDRVEGQPAGSGPMHTWWVSESGVADMIVFAGPTPADVMHQYHLLTGFAPMPGQWALGKHQCRWNYRDEKDVELVNKNYDKYDIPMDVIWLDIEHTDGKKYFTWSPTYFPTPKEMMKGIEHTKRKLVTIVDPHIKKEDGYSVYTDIRDHGFCTKKIDWQMMDDPTDKKPEDWVEVAKIPDPEATEPEDWNKEEDGEWERPKMDNPGYKGQWTARQITNPDSPLTDFDGWCWPGTSIYPDFTHPEMRALWASKFAFEKYEGSTKDVFTWNDMNEPSVFNGPEVTMPRDVLHPYGNVEHRDVHNIYGGYVQRATFEGHLARDPDSRPFVLTRSFFVGAHRWGAIWTGDNDASWEHVRISVPMILSLALGGNSFVGADVGGFFRHPEKECIIRWYQLGALAYPFFRQHAHLETPRREPWTWGEEAIKSIKHSVQTRYKLMPFWYTLFSQFHKRGLPVVRPLYFDFIEDQATHNDPVATEDSIMVGDALLVRAVYKPLKEQDKVPVLLPAGKHGGWYDFFSGTFFPPGRYDATLNIESIPAFWRAGSIVPTKTRIRRSTECMHQDPFTLAIYINPTTSAATGRVYIDDYKSNQYKTGDFLDIELEYSGGVLKQAAATGTLKADVGTLVERVEIYGLKSAATSVTVEIAGHAPSSPTFSSRDAGDGTNFIATVKKPGIDLKAGSTWSLKVV